MAFGNLGLNKTSINQLAQAINGNQVTAQSGYFKGTGGTIIGNPMKLDSSPPQHNPKFLDIKTGPAIKYIYAKKGANEGETPKEYPSLYIYLGTIPSLSLTGINIINEWVNRESHPVVFSYFDGRGSEMSDFDTFIRNEDGTKGDKLDLSGASEESVKSASIELSTTTDGWFELPCTSYDAMPLYGVCFVGAGMQLNFALVTFNEVVVNAQQTWYFDDPERCPFSMPSIFEWCSSMPVNCFYGLIGCPIKMYGLAPSSDKDVPTVDWSGRVPVDMYDVVRIYDNANTMIFRDDSSPPLGSVHPVLQRVRVDDYTTEMYDFFIPAYPRTIGALESGTVQKISISNNRLEITGEPEDVYEKDFLVPDSSHHPDIAYSILGADGGVINLIQPSDVTATGCNVLIKSVTKNFPCGPVPGLSILPNPGVTNPFREISITFDKAVYLYVVPYQFAGNIDETDAMERGWYLFLSNRPPFTITGDFHTKWRLVEPIFDTRPVCICCILPQYISPMVAINSLVKTPWSDPPGNFYQNVGFTSTNDGVFYFTPRYISRPIPQPDILGDSGLQADQFAEEDPEFSGQTGMPGMQGTQWGSVELLGMNSITTPGDSWKAYGLYKFRDNTTKIPNSSMEENFDATKVLDTATDVVVRVKNLPSVDGAHVEYIKLTDLANYCRNEDPYNPYVKKDDLPDYIPDITDDLYWKKGGDHNDNYGKSFKLGDGNNWITVSYMA